MGGKCRPCRRGVGTLKATKACRIQVPRWTMSHQGASIPNPLNLPFLSLPNHFSSPCLRHTSHSIGNAGEESRQRRREGRFWSLSLSASVHLARHPLLFLSKSLLQTVKGRTHGPGMLFSAVARFTLVTGAPILVQTFWL